MLPLRRDEALEDGGAARILCMDSLYIPSAGPARFKDATDEEILKLKYRCKDRHAGDIVNASDWNGHVGEDSAADEVQS